MERLLRDGVALACEAIGSGDPPLVFIHGWCCDHTYFAPQVAHFRDRHRCVLLDLRGHGGSDKPEQPYTIPGFADDVAWLCRQLGVARPVLVGHSMGGSIAFDVAARYPDLPAAVVMLDSAVSLSPAAREAVGRLVAQLRGPDYVAAARAYVENALFIPSDDAAQKARILDAMAGAPQYVMVAMENLASYDAAAVASGIRAPVAYIAGNEPVPRTDPATLRALLPNAHVGQTIGSGHFVQLEVPAQINAMIERFLQLVPA